MKESFDSSRDYKYLSCKENKMKAPFTGLDYFSRNIRSIEINSYRTAIRNYDQTTGTPGFGKSCRSYQYCCDRSAATGNLSLR